MSAQVEAGKVGELADGAMKSVSTKEGGFLLAMVGKALKSPKNLRTYRVRVKDDQLLIEL